jgi:hypothetical protein
VRGRVARHCSGRRRNAGLRVQHARDSRAIRRARSSTLAGAPPPALQHEGELQSCRAASAAGARSRRGHRVRGRALSRARGRVRRRFHCVQWCGQVRAGAAGRAVGRNPHVQRGVVLRARAAERGGGKHGHARAGRAAHQSRSAGGHAASLHAHGRARKQIRHSDRRGARGRKTGARDAAHSASRPGHAHRLPGVSAGTLSRRPRSPAGPLPADARHGGSRHSVPRHRWRLCRDVRRRNADGPRRACGRAPPQDSASPDCHSWSSRAASSSATPVCCSRE